MADNEEKAWLSGVRTAAAMLVRVEAAWDGGADNPFLLPLHRAALQFLKDAENRPGIGRPVVLEALGQAGRRDLERLLALVQAVADHRREPVGDRTDGRP